MPKYELMYILASSVSDDQVPSVTSGVIKFIEDFGGSAIVENQLGKKKLAYPIKKTRNGYYVVAEFNMDAKQVNAFEAKIRTQTSTIIRHIIVKLDKHLARLSKDTATQAKMAAKRPESMRNQEATQESSPITEINIDEQIEAAINENPAV